MLDHQLGDYFFTFIPTTSKKKVAFKNKLINKNDSMNNLMNGWSIDKYHGLENDLRCRVAALIIKLFFINYYQDTIHQIDGQ